MTDSREQAQRKVSPMARVIRWSVQAGGWLAALASIAGVGLLLVWLAGFFHPKVGPAPADVVLAQAVAGGGTLSVQRIRRPQYETAVGTVKPVHEVAVAAKILAKVLEVRPKAGQAVAVGELLVRLDNADLIARKKQAEAGLQASAANRDRATTELARAEKLVASKAIAQSEYDDALAASKAANAEYERLQQVMEEANIQLSYAEIHSTIAGTIVDRRVEEGDTVSPGQVLLTLYDPQHMQLVATVRESFAQRLKVGQRVPVRLDALGYTCEAQISEIVPEANAATRSFDVKVTGPCPPGIYSGMFGRLMIPLEEEEVLAIPASAVLHIGQLTMVQVIEHGLARRRSIRLGRNFEDQVEVLSGLREGETIAVR